MPPVLRVVTGLVALLSATIAPPSVGEGALRIFVGIEPLQYLVERVGGERTDVTVVVKGTQRPETYEPSPRQIAGLAAADLFFGVGLPLENEWRRQLRVVAERAPQWVDLSAGLEGTGEPSREHETSGNGHGHDDIDPHVWLSPSHARRMVAAIRDVLSRLDPGGEAVYERNAAEVDRELEALDREIAAILRDSPVEVFLVFHPAWGHFARDYGLEQLAIEAGGKEPGPRAMIEVIRRAKEAGIGTVFVDPRHSTTLAERVADAIGADIETLDPLSPDYPDNLRRAARAIAASGR